MSALDKAVKAAGGTSALAKKIGVTQAAVSNWKKRKSIPADRVLAIEAATEGAVSRHELRSDLYPQEAA